ncbi:MAG: amidohydrolase family protein [Candidatus Dormibacteria bacterium]
MRALHDPILPPELDFLPATLSTKVSGPGTISFTTVDDLATTPQTDADVPAFIAGLGLPGIFDVHVHFMPERMQQAVWRHFDSLPQPWPIHYRSDDATRVATLREIGVPRYSALAYAHKPGMADWLNQFTLDFADANPAAIPSFTFYPEPGVSEYVAHALTRGGRVAKVHLQVSKFDPLDAHLGHTWEQLVETRTPVVIHAGAVPDGSGGERWCGMDPVRALLNRYPGLALVLAHLGAPDYDDAVRLAEDFPQLRMDTAMTLVDGTGFDVPASLVTWLRKSPGRVLFGSDFPTIPHSYAAQVRGLAVRGFGEDWLRRVFWHNAADLFGD